MKNSILENIKFAHTAIHLVDTTKSFESRLKASQTLILAEGGAIGSCTAKPVTKSEPESSLLILRPEGRVPNYSCSQLLSRHQHFDNVRFGYDHAYRLMLSKSAFDVAFKS